MPNTALDLAAELAKRFEGLKDGDLSKPGLQPYRDPVGLWTIGWGHLISADPAIPQPDITLTEEESEDLLRKDLQLAVGIVSRLVRVPLTEEQAAALIDFVFNLGWNLRGSTLLSRLNRGDYVGAADEFPKWVYSRKIKLGGLVRRRAAERILFLA